MAVPPGPLPKPNFKWTNPGLGMPEQAFAQYMLSLDALVRGLAGGNIGPLVNAANDAAAAAAGVAIGGLYRNVNAVQIRLV